MENIKNIVIYTRVSSDKQVDEGGSLDTQQRILIEYAKLYGFNIVKHFREEGESAKTANRPRLQEMQQYCHDNKSKVDAVVVYKIDRMARNTADYANLRLFFGKLGIRMLSATEQIDDSPSGRFIETVFSAQAQLDNENRAERSKNGMIDAVREGRHVHKAPIGYINTRVDGKKNVAPDYDTSYVEVIRASWILINDGYGMEEARGIVNARMVEINRKEIAMQTFSRMLRNKLYKGVVCEFGMEVQSRSIKPIVDAELFDSVQLILAGKKNKGKQYTKNNPKYPLRGILWCANGHKLTGSSPHGRGGYYPKYHCPKCKGLGISYDVPTVNDEFLVYTKDIEIKNDVRDALREAIRLNLGDTQKANADSIKQLNKDLVEIAAKKREVIEKNIQQIISNSTTKEMLDDYEREEIDKRMQLADIAGTTDDAEELMEFGLSKLTNLSHTFEAIDDINVRMRFQKWLFPAGLTYDGQKFGTSALPLIYRVKQNTLAGVLPDNSHLVSHVDITWNSFLPYLINLTDKLEDLGFRYVDNKVIVLKEDLDDK